MVPPLTAEEAAALHAASLMAVCEQVGSVGSLDTKLVVTPDERVADLSKLFVECRLANEESRMTGKSEAPAIRHSTFDIRHSLRDCWPQGDGDLGRRLARATGRALSAGAVGVLLLGADSPTLPVSFLTRAVADLPEHDAVLGPCEDGGYYLLGLRWPLPVLFERIDWGGACVADQTRQRAAEAGIDLCELPTWYDLDRFDDVKRAAQDLRRAASPVLSGDGFPEETPSPKHARSGQRACHTAAVALRSLIDTLVETYAKT